MIDCFAGRYSFLSNFFPSSITWEGLTYRSVEHAYQASKTLDLGWRKKIADEYFASSAKKLGRQAPLRDSWEVVKVDVMDQLLRLKFRSPRLKQLLLETGNEELAEGNYWGDTFWGVCEGVGENHLGKLLMEIREELRSAM